MGALPAVLLVAAMASAFAAVFVAARLLLRLISTKGGGLQGFRSAAQGIQGRMASYPLVSKINARLLARKRKRRREQMRGVLPDAVQMIATSLSAGSSLPKAFDYAASNCSEPLAGELKRTVWEMESGQGFAAAMASLRNRVGIPELDYLAVAMEVQHKCGGSLGSIMESTVEVLRQQAELREDFLTKTTQGRTSAKVVAFMPVVLLLVFSLVSPGYLSDFFGSALGIVIFCLGVVLELAGVLLVVRVSGGGQRMAQGGAM